MKKCFPKALTFFVSILCVNHSFSQADSSLMKYLVPSDFLNQVLYRVSDKRLNYYNITNYRLIDDTSVQFISRIVAKSNSYPNQQRLISSSVFTYYFSQNQVLKCSTNSYNFEKCFTFLKVPKFHKDRVKWETIDINGDHLSCESYFDTVHIGNIVLKALIIKRYTKDASYTYEKEYYVPTYGLYKITVQSTASNKPIGEPLQIFLKAQVDGSFSSQANKPKPASFPRIKSQDNTDDSAYFLSSSKPAAVYEQKIESGSGDQKKRFYVRGLKGRIIVSSSYNEDDFTESAKVAVDIVIDKVGKVTYASINPAGTTTKNKNILAIALKKARAMRFNEGIEEVQQGTIVLDFKVK